MMKIAIALAVLAVAGGLLKYAFVFDLLTGFSSDEAIPSWQLKAAVLGFCVSPLVSKVESIVEMDESQKDEEYSFNDTGGINEADYTKGSVYSILYSAYAAVGRMEAQTLGNRTYEFTFNTWGVAPSEVGADDPQRFGKTSYGYFARSTELQQHVDSLGGKVQVVEIGCGTGAGASHLSTKVFPKSQYMAIDMQKGAIKTCNRLHASDRLQCVHIPSGVGNEGGVVPLADGTVDIVIVLETHIAEERIGPEEKAIFAEIQRLLKPGGYFLWGNALPTEVWGVAEEHLTASGMKTIERWNNTRGAVEARDEDAPRVAEFMGAVRQHIDVAFGLPYFGPRCFEVVDKLVRNFFRDPGTALYDKMATGKHSYMHYIFQQATRTVG